MSITKVCCTCLSFDVEMLSLADDEIRECLEKVVTNIKVELEDEFLQNVCTECVLMMRKFVKFKDRCLEANLRLRRILSQSTYISEALLKAESRQLYSETIISFDDIPIIPDIKVSLLQVKQEEFHNESESRVDFENTTGTSLSQTDVNIHSVKFDAKLEQSPEHVETDQCDSYTQDDGISVISEIEEDSKKNRIKSPQKKKIKSSLKKNTSLVKKKSTSWKSDFAVKITLTKEQQMEELSKKELSESYLNASFKCSDCFTGFISQEKYEQHKKLHDESRGAWQCDVCKLRYCNLLRLRLHQTSHRRQYKCLTCGTATKTQKQARRHHNRHVGIMFECKVCEEKFKQKSLYRRHTRTAHPTDYVCSLCGDYFISQYSLGKHNKNSEDCRKSPKTILKCKMCGVPFLKVNRWYNHMLGHAKEKEQIAPTECQICGYKTTTWNDWSLHIVYEHRKHNKDDTKKHLNKKPAMMYICDVCGSALSSKAILSLHIKTKHTNDNAVSPHQRFKWQDKCEICNKNILRNNMKRHMQTHTGEKPYKCDVCGKCFAQTYTRDKHAREVHQIMDKPEVLRRKWYSKDPNSKSSEAKEMAKKFQCQQCPKKFHRKIGLEMHDRSHTGEKPYSCDVCQRSYFSKYYLEIHKNIHTGEKPYACDMCDQRFHNKSYLQIHKNNHDGEKRYACDICDMRFKQKSNLTSHKIVHTSAKNWTCDLCGKLFKQLKSLNLHIKTVHLHMPHPPRKPRKKRE